MPTTTDVIDEAGTPRHEQMFAAFPDMDAAQAAAAKLDLGSAEPTYLTGDDASLLRGKDRASGALNQVKRLTKSLYGGEDDMAARYAERLEAGCAVLAVPVENREAARAMADRLARLGAVDIGYFGQWTNEFFHSEVIGSRPPETMPESQGDATL